MSVQPRHPTRIQVVLFTGALLLVCAVSAQLKRGYLASVEANGDNDEYAAISSAIAAGDPGPAADTKVFWGLPYAVAALRMTGIGAVPAIALISLAGTLASAWLAMELWSGWVALYFVALNYTLLEFGSFGGSEPLFTTLLFAALYFAREGRWKRAALAASCATTVRPLGVLALAALDWSLLRSRQVKTVLAAAGISIAVFALYAAPPVFRAGGLFRNFHAYQTMDWQGSSPISFPLSAIVANIRNGSHIPSQAMLVLKCGWVAGHIGALACVLGLREHRRAFFSRRIEATLALSYSVFILMYSSPLWALTIYPRLLMPITPIFLNAFAAKLPMRWPVVAGLGLVSAALAIGSDLAGTAVT